MKFSKHLKDKVNEFYTEEYKAYTIPYKVLKKAYKFPTIETEIHGILLKQCVQIDEVFKSHVKASLRPKQNATTSCKCGGFKIEPEVNPRELIEFATLNTTAIYKICKKLQKRGVASFDTYNTLRNKHHFAFMGSGELTLLRLKAAAALDEPLDECPICLEDAPSKIAVMTCGHWVCWTCLDSMTNIQKIKGTLNNRILNASLRTSCPVCRKHDPLRLGSASVVELQS